MIRWGRNSSYKNVATVQKFFCGTSEELDSTAEKLADLSFTRPGHTDRCRDHLFSFQDRKVENLCIFRSKTEADEANILSLLEHLVYTLAVLILPATAR